MDGDPPAESEEAVPTGPRTLLSSCSGRIEHVLFVLTGRMLDPDPSPAERLLRLAGSLPRISVVVHESSEPLVADLLGRLRLRATVETIAAPAEAELWAWTQDRFAVCRADSDQGLVIVDCAGSRRDATSRYAAKARGIRARTTTAVPLAGGNMLADGAICLLGADLRDSFARSAPRTLDGGGPARIDREFRRAFSTEVETARRIHIVEADTRIPQRGPMRFEMTPGDLSWRQDVDRGVSWDGSRQPVFHLDMFMTLAGRTPAGQSRVLLGDPVWASRIIGVPLPAGYPAAAFAKIERSLTDNGLAVIRNPLPFVYFDDPDARMREWFHASANNCWVEHVAAGKSRVWLPEYGFGAWPELRATDDANAALWQELGFEVVRAGDFLDFADQLGALNCVSKILSRS